jgi:hypothetical protein
MLAFLQLVLMLFRGEEGLSELATVMPFLSYFMILG